MKLPRIIGPKEKPDAHSWPRNLVKSVETRKRDVVIRIADWTRNREEPSYDVEVYIHGVYDWNESQTFGVKECGSEASARGQAICFAEKQFAKHVK